MSAHLKGPWHIVEREAMEDGSVYPRHVSTEDGAYQICLLESARMAAIGYDRTPAEQKRDRLIAAAPDLLAVAQFFLRGIEGGHIKCAPYIDFDPDAEALEIKSPDDLLRSAIAKATGGQQ